MIQAPEAKEEPAAEEQPAEDTAEESKDEGGSEGGEEEPEDEEEPKPDINVRHCLLPMPKQHLLICDTGIPRRR